MDPDKSVKQIKKLYEDSKTAKTTGLATWFQVSFPDMSDAFFVIAECGREIPMPEIAQNEAATMSISLIISTYKGLDTKKNRRKVKIFLRQKRNDKEKNYL